MCSTQSRPARNLFFFLLKCDTQKKKPSTFSLSFPLGLNYTTAAAAGCVFVFSSVSQLTGQFDSSESQQEGCSCAVFLSQTECGDFYVSINQLGSAAIASN